MNSSFETALLLQEQLAHERFADVAQDERSLTDELLALEIFNEELRLLRSQAIDRVTARSLAEAEGIIIIESDDDSDSDVEILEHKAIANCVCCLGDIASEDNRRALPCGHTYCTGCISMRCKIGVKDRSFIPAHCCKKEFPIEYVNQVLNTNEFEMYKRVMQERNWTQSDLASDADYSNTVRTLGGKQCPQCGIGVIKIVGCNRIACLNRHEFCYLCGLAWKTCQCSYY